MPRAKTEPIQSGTSINLAASPETEEAQMIALATNLARERLLNGTASSQEIVYYLKLGASTTRYENEKLKEEITLLKAKTDQIESAKRVEELYSKALDSMRIYKGESTDEDIQ